MRGFRLHSNGKPCLHPDSTASLPGSSQGYIQVILDGGLNQRMGIRLGWSDVAMIAGAKDVGISPSIISMNARKKLACQCSYCNCKNTWGSYDCSCSGNLLYTPEHDTCIGEYGSAKYNTRWSFVWVRIVSLAVARVAVNNEIDSEGNSTKRAGAWKKAFIHLGKAQAAGRGCCAPVFGGVHRIQKLALQ